MLDSSDSEYRATGAAAFKEGTMIKVKSFTSQIKILETMRELDNLDAQVNRFFSENGIQEVVSVSDTSTTDDTGATIGMIRVVAYKE